MKCAGILLSLLFPCALCAQQQVMAVSEEQERQPPAQRAFARRRHIRREGGENNKKEIGAWMGRNGEGIYSTRPWEVFGEGPIAESDIAINAQGFNEGAYLNAGASEIRFTQTPKHLYAIVLDWPADNVVNIKSLAKGSALHGKSIKSVELVGHGKVKCERTAEGLRVELPAEAKTMIPVIKIKKMIRKET